jgi:dephospho-CoA kinase
MLLGLTGGYCAGKNAVAEILEKKGFICFDLDKLGHEALGEAEVLAALVDRFGEGILDSGGALDRRALGEIVFEDPEALAWEEGIVHPAVYRLLRPRMEAALAAGRDVCLNAALLYRMPEAARCQAIIEVRAPLYMRVIRGCARDSLGIRAVLARIWRQRSFWKKRGRLGVPVMRFVNGGRRDELELGVERALEKLQLIIQAS